VDASQRPGSQSPKPPTGMPNPTSPNMFSEPRLSSASPQSVHRPYAAVARETRIGSNTPRSTDSPPPPPSLPPGSPALLDASMNPNAIGMADSRHGIGQQPASSAGSSAVLRQNDEPKNPISEPTKYLSRTFSSSFVKSPAIAAAQSQLSRRKQGDDIWMQKSADFQFTPAGIEAQNR